MKLIVTALSLIAAVACANGSDGPGDGTGGSNTGGQCGVSESENPPVGCSGERTWQRKPQSATCIATWAGCEKPTEGEDFWMSFGSLVECQQVTCKDGDVRPAGDGCNTCTCATAAAPNLERGYWTCSNDACGSAQPTGKACGYFEGPCGAGEYCAFSPAQACSSTDAPSICMTRPGECTDEDAPVCGCNRKEYRNRCEAARDGTGIWSFGSCRQSEQPATCGGLLGATCGDQEYCAYRAGQACGAADATAKCLPRPEACIAMDAPVCGCDGKTYPNACEAARAGTGVKQDGACCEP